ncbi:ABC-2 type transport system permease protein [Corynebacterium mycetoides]|uniref:ABC-2 type transport system permease protein n=1 Tax=Corynebacterium mycetoides TaxID=38302 RepID=A0A1G9L8X7_9CORY|nr:ABC transporter permease [Corynebacterium mycetoides]SDL58401.1 ABC-2 type transport system permease protein [Corynebacterium mycetoides]
MAATRPYSPAHTIRTTAVREIQVLSRMKSIWVTVALLLAAIVGLIGFLSWQANKDADQDAAPVAVVGVPAAAFAGSPFDAREVGDRAEAEQLVRDGDVDTAIVAGPNGWEVMEDGGPSASTMSTIESIASSYATARALDSLGVSQQEYAQALPATQVTSVDLSADGDRTDEDFARLLTVFVALVVIIFTIFLFAANIGGRVTSEKSSRVVELILASVRPLDFLAGKILGNVIFGFVLTVLILAVGAIALSVSGLADTADFSRSILTMLPVLLVAWLLSMLFFGALYAAAGSMVQRTEDLQSTQSPIMLLLITTMYVPLFGWTQTSAGWMQVMSWIPPVSILTAPLTYAAGDFTLAQLLGSFALAAVATAGAVWVAARIYRNSILNNGRKMTWLKALRS